MDIKKCLGYIENAKICCNKLAYMLTYCNGI